MKEKLAHWHWDLDNIDEGKYMASLIPHCKYNSRMPFKIFNEHRKTWK